MKLQGRNLPPQMQGEDVKLLQHELSQLGFAIPFQELENSQFGVGTRQARWDGFQAPWTTHELSNL